MKEVGDAAAEERESAIEPSQFAEPGDLTLAVRIVSLFGAARSAHQKRDAMVQKADPSGKVGRLRHRKSEACSRRCRR